MKDAPAKSVVEGDFTVAQSGEAANETFNEMQRSRGGDTVTEDESRYHVVVHRPEEKEIPDWTGEVTGPPSFFPLSSVDVVVGGKMLIVLDKMNKKMWQSPLSYRVVAGPAAFDEERMSSGSGPCVERGDALYVFDEAVLTAFDLKTGSVRWRLPSVGTISLFFDDEGMMYVNTTTASPESIKYSRQIDITQKTGALVFKLDPRTGRTLWAATPGGFITYVSGKFVYTLSSHQEDESADSRFKTGLEIPSYVMIQRISPGSGHVIWSCREPRAPLHVWFDGNSIQLVFRKEVEVLKFLSL
jgi:outer membrane protein assembly factor BamB